MSDKKRWFIAYSSRLWIPVSWEGGVIFVASFLSILLIFRVNGLFSNGDRPFSLSNGLPMIIEVLVAVVIFYWITKGHVEKRY